jgi:hypothetical protein
MTPKPRRCQCCGADAEQNYLRMTKCQDGELRRLCEYCALDEEQAKAEMVAKAQRRAS